MGLFSGNTTAYEDKTLEVVEVNIPDARWKFWSQSPKRTRPPPLHIAIYRVQQQRRRFLGNMFSSQQVLLVELERVEATSKNDKEDTFSATAMGGS